ncbi:MAG: hypothetical protein R2764_17660 [Bacteroidales bacterium]
MTIEQEKNKSLLSALPDFLYIINKTGRILDCQVPEYNPLNFNKEDFINNYVEDILPAETMNLR